MSSADLSQGGENKVNNKEIIIIDHFSYNSVEKDTITMVLYHLLSSSHLPDTIKSRIRIAAGLGKQNHCHIFTCEVNPELLQA